MTGPFGSGVPTVLRRPYPVRGSQDVRGVLAAATEHARSGRGAPPALLLGGCTPTAAFSRRDTLLPGYGAAAALAASSGFEPVVRPVGGHLAAYDEGSLVVHLWGAHPDPRRDLQARFRLVGEALADAAAELGVPDPRVGAVPGEYCDGAWSVNSGGRAKLAGTGQRLFRGGYLFCAVVTVTRPEPVRALLAAAYEELGLPLDPATVGCLADHAPGVTVADAREVVAAALTRMVESTQVAQTALGA